MNVMRPLPVFCATAAVTAWLLSRFGHHDRLAAPAAAPSESDALGDLLAAQRQARSEAETTTQALDELLGTLSHAMRTPLGALASATEVLKQAKPDSPLVPKALAVISRQTSALSGILADALEVAGVANGSTALRREPADFARLVDDAVAALPDADRARLQVGRLEAVHVAADRKHLDNVIAQMLRRRAWRGLPDAGMLEATLRRAGDAAVLTVMWHGNADEVAWSDGGLALARRIAALHGGALDVDSTSVGRALALRLPALASRAVHDAPAEPVSQARAASRSIAIVDAAESAAALAAQLIGAGHEVRCTSNDAAGLALISDARPDIAIIGLDAEGLDALDLARRVRAAGYPGLMLAVASPAEAPDLRAVVRAGFDARVDRPLDLTKLHMLARAHL